MTDRDNTDWPAIHPATMVGLSPNYGIAIPSYDDADPIPLSLRQVEALCFLAGAPRPPDPDDDQVHSLVTLLNAAGLIADGARPGDASPSSDAPGAPTDDQDLDAETQVLAITPLVFAPTASGLRWEDADGEHALVLTARELFLAASFTKPTTATVAAGEFAYLSAASGVADAAPDVPAALAMARSLGACGLLEPIDETDSGAETEESHRAAIRTALRRRAALYGEFDRRTDEFAAAEAQRVSQGLASRIPVHPVWYDENIPGLALGYLVAYATEHCAARTHDHFAFHPRFLARKGHVDVDPSQPAIYLYSNYIWTHLAHLESSAAAKQENPLAITIHGGPNTPKYPADCERYMADYPHVDVTVRGEGEATFAAMLDALAGARAAGSGDADEPLDLTALIEVPGLSVRTPDGIVHTPDRDRIVDLDTVPSPLLTGLFDGYAAATIPSFVLETNRGCPYGCTFCDWGSATLSRIRKFDMDRVLAEIEWCSAHSVGTIAIADANFGIFARDVDIARHVADLHNETGYPSALGTNYAKNTVKHLRPIIEILADAGMIVEGVVSLQSMDTETLHSIKRKNIKVSKYDELSAEFRASKLPLAVDIMMGLPGSTLASFRNDLQECTDREVRVRVHPTILLPNSPMNAPEYRAEHGIVAPIDDILMETTSYTRADFDRMAELRRAFYALDHYGLARHLARHIRRRTGRREIDTFEAIFEIARRHPDRYPATAFIARAFQRAMVPPVSWHVLYTELRHLVVEHLDTPDDDELTTVLAVQRALIPTQGRSYPHRVSLPHDYAAWHREMAAAREGGHQADWHEVVGRLRDYGPAELMVEDPDDVSGSMIGRAVDRIAGTYGNWDLDSPVSRPRLATAGRTPQPQPQP